MSSVSISTPALTTVFTPPPTCIPFTDVGTLVDGNYYHEYNPLTTDGWTSCYPPYFTDAWTIDPHLTPSYYSPGICASGYTMCDDDCISDYVSFWGLDSTSETGGRCCLSGWSVTPVAEYCVRTTAGTTVTAPGINIRWKASDLSLYEPNSPGMANQALATGTPTATVISMVTTTVSTTGGHSHGLGVGGEVGLGVGLGLLVLILIVSIVAFFLLRARRNWGHKGKKTADISDLTHNDPPYGGRAELAAPYHFSSGATEIDSKPVSELG